MKKIFFQLISMSALVVTANAQSISVGAQYSLLTGHGANDNHSTLSGATVFGTFSIKDNMTTGAVIHAYAPKKSNYKSGDFAYKATDDVTNIAISYEISFGPKGSSVQPFMGVDMGLSTSNHKVEYYNDMNKLIKVNLKQAYVMMSPKAGVIVALTKTLGVYSQAQYNFSPGNGGTTVIHVQNAKSRTSFTTEPISKYYNIDTGIYLRIGNIRSIFNNRN